MVFFSFKGKTIKAEVIKELSSWELNNPGEYWSDPKRIAEQLKYDLQRKFNEDILKHIDMKFNDGFLDKIADEIIKDFDIKPIYEAALKDKVKNFFNR